MDGSSHRRQLENDWEDVLNKAVRGAGLATRRLASATGVSDAKLQRILGGEQPSDVILERLAQVLELQSSALLDIAHNRYSPSPFDPSRWPGVAQVPSICFDEVANAYLVWQPSVREAVLIDPSGHFRAVHRIIESEDLSLKAVCVTHTHGDHVGTLGEVMRAYHPQLFAPQREPLAGATLIGEGTEIPVGGLKACSILVNGHSPGHLVYIFEGGRGWSAPVAFVGDALFAGSMGYGNVSYERLRRNVQKLLRTLPPSTLLCPGHGPCTTVEEEREHNPFA